MRIIEIRSYLTALIFESNRFLKDGIKTFFNIVNRK